MILPSGENCNAFFRRVESVMTSLAMDPITLVHVAIALVALFAGAMVVPPMASGFKHRFWTPFFLAATALSSASGFLFSHPPGPFSPAERIQ